MEVIRGKEWAKGLEQNEFIPEFIKRFPHSSDCIPDVKEWIFKEPVKYHGIEPFSPELLVDADAAKPEIKRDVGILYCRGCKREFNFAKGNPLARAAHERHCKTLLNTKI